MKFITCALLSFVVLAGTLVVWPVQRLLEWDAGRERRARGR